MMMSLEYFNLFPRAVWVWKSSERDDIIARVTLIEHEP